jgi:uncharacterized membrane protein
MQSTSFTFAGLRQTSCVLALLASGAAMAQSVATQYSITAEMPAPATLPNAVAFRLNNAGQAAGSGVYTQGTVTRLVIIGGKLKFVTTPVERSMAVSWANGKATLLKPLSANAATSIGDINDNGWVVGDSFKSTTAAKGYATVWRNGVVTDLGAGLGSAAQRVNSQGWVLGVRPLANSVISEQAFIWRNNRIENLGTYPPGLTTHSTNCVGLSDAGTVACRSLVEVGIGALDWHSYLWNNGVFQELSYPGATDILVSAVSRNGNIAGTMALAGDAGAYDMPDRPFVWRDGVFTILPRVAAGFYANILAVNDQGTVLTELNSATGFRQELWSASGSVVVLPGGVSVSSGDAVIRVHDLNDNGQLLAAVKKGSSGTERQVLLTPLLP